MKILLAPDKFKGSLSAKEICQSIEKGLKKQGNHYEIIHHPMADGGDGSLEILSDYLNLKSQTILTCDPLGTSISAKYFTSANAAFIEVASASGLVLLKPEERNPLKTSTFGTGKMIADALSKGFSHIYLFLGGSATNDAGMGIATALGCQFLDKNGKTLAPIGENLLGFKKIIPSSDFNFENIKMTLLCDVTNPLFGENGAAYIYAAQKGASQKEIENLDKGLRNFSQVIQQETGTDVNTLPGSGAAGGIGAGLVAIFGATMKKGFDVISALTNLEKHIQQADYVISGEGKLDQQSLQGKVIDGVAKLCQKHQKPLTLLVGKNELQNKETDILHTSQIFSIVEKVSNMEDAMLNGAKYLEEMAFNLLPIYKSKTNSIFEKIDHDLVAAEFEFERKDFNRPWGGFWVIDEAQTKKFAEKYFPDFAIDDLTKGLKVSPKILLVAPHKRLSWQYHNRRSEIWKVIQGKVGVVKSDTDERKTLQEYSAGKIIVLQKGERHRLVGLDNWAMVAEIWQHTDPKQPSDEDDIVRLQDDFNRETPK